MSDAYIAPVRWDDRSAMAAVDALLEGEGIRRDAHLDYTCAIFDARGRMLATGSCYRNTLRCFAVSAAHRGEGLMNHLLTHLIHYQADRGIFHLFLYTKPETAELLNTLGFYEIARVPGRLVFMENRRRGFADYLQTLAASRRDGSSAAIVMNANPFTLGHRYLVEQAAASCENLHLFIVSEDLSEIPFRDRKAMVARGTADLPNVVLHDCGPYLISAATFPSYFLKDVNDQTECQARLDAEVFKAIAGALNITERWVGDEPDSRVTALYNCIMGEALPIAGIRCTVLHRKEANGTPISASAVRACLRRGDFDAIKTMVPASTLAYLTGPQGDALRHRLTETAE